MTTPKKTTISLDMQIGDAAFLRIAKMAHANNLTFNQQVNEILADAMRQIDASKPAQPSPVVSHGR
jgi:hypothetical protein